MIERTAILLWLAIAVVGIIIGWLSNAIFNAVF